jgi:uncharacterized damage-inducible protein DinB
MTEVDRMADQIRRAWNGDAWHGPPLRPLLSGVPAAVANARPVPAAHTIAEIVLHLAFWKDVVRQRLGGARLLPADEDSWPAVRDAGEAAWQEAVALLDRRQQELAEAVARLTDEQLGNPVAGKDYTNYVLIHGAVQHDSYHAGQIALLKKAAPGRA